jgi:hypothetical protein
MRLLRNVLETHLQSHVPPSKGLKQNFATDVVSVSIAGEDNFQIALVKGHLVPELPKAPKLEMWTCPRNS